MKDEFLRKVGLELLLIRTEHNDRLEDLSNKCGVAPSTLSKYENGREDMSLVKLEQILKSYDITLSIFFARTLARTQVKENENECKE